MGIVIKSIFSVNFSMESPTSTTEEANYFPFLPAYPPSARIMPASASSQANHFLGTSVQKAANRLAKNLNLPCQRNGLKYSATEPTDLPNLPLQMTALVHQEKSPIVNIDDQGGSEDMEAPEQCFFLNSGTPGSSKLISVTQSPKADQTITKLWSTIRRDNSKSPNRSPKSPEFSKFDNPFRECRNKSLESRKSAREQQEESESKVLSRKNSHSSGMVMRCASSNVRRVPRYSLSPSAHNKLERLSARFEPLKKSVERRATVENGLPTQEIEVSLKRVLETLKESQYELESQDHLTKNEWDRVKNVISEVREALMKKVELPNKQDSTDRCNFLASSVYKEAIHMESLHNSSQDIEKRLPSNQSSPIKKTYRSENLVLIPESGEILEAPEDSSCMEEDEEVLGPQLITNDFSMGGGNLHPWMDEPPAENEEAHGETLERGEKGVRLSRMPQEKAEDLFMRRRAELLAVLQARKSATHMSRNFEQGFATTKAYRPKHEQQSYQSQEKESVRMQRVNTSDSHFQAERSNLRPVGQRIYDRPIPAKYMKNSEQINDSMMTTKTPTRTKEEREEAIRRSHMLYLKGKQQLRELETQKEENEAQREQKLLKACTFHPKIKDLSEGIELGEFEERQYKWVENKTMKVRQMQEEKRRAEEMNCPFAPETNFQERWKDKTVSAEEYYQRNIEWQQKVKAKLQAKQAESEKEVQPPPTPVIKVTGPPQAAAARAARKAAKSKAALEDKQNNQAVMTEQGSNSASATGNKSARSTVLTKKASQTSVANNRDKEVTSKDRATEKREREENRAMALARQSYLKVRTDASRELDNDMRMSKEVARLLSAGSLLSPLEKSVYK
eukprot:TRINITY_DN1283_c0_g1_i3.p1 TRINITY_DN1283_c0_g1~~TRINITY_DN1283_c0_g1_i3.p1  ORF type:complete len:848 (-),score=228.60 TRINITY_DN1283_c0_g1_i3:729-3272(-)